MVKPKIDLGELYKPHNRQKLAHIAPERCVLYGGAFGGGKTIWLVNEAIQLSLDYPGNMGYLCRDELPSFRRSVLIELEKYIHPSILLQHHHTENYLKLDTYPYQKELHPKVEQQDCPPSYIYYGGLGDDKAGLSRLSSMSLGWFGIDQAEETTATHFNMLMGRLRLKLPGIHYKALLTCNPAPGWVKQLFIEQKKPGFTFIRSLPKDNPHLPPDYEPTLRAIYPPEWVKAMLEGSWDALEGGNFLFRYIDIRKAINREVEIKEDDINWMGVDIAREGDDESVATIRQGHKVIQIQSWAKTDLMQTAGKTLTLIEKFGLDPKNVNLDAIGVGAGVYDRLKEQKVYVNGVIAGGEPMDNEHYINSRAEMYGLLQKRFEEEPISIPDDQDLSAQLSSIRFKIASDRKLQIVSKEEMKRQYRLKSPDKADSLALAFYEPIQRNPNIRWL